ncbi:APC family permease [Pseudonocardia sp. GCM10023141]|uniref:APC family permease n=1 Tax=Pseudonocardia sp. GCM10023141 TaxID=3252653 RepID=UPI00360F073D
MTTSKELPTPTTPTLRANALGLGGAVVMSAAIMGPAVSTFFNPQFSTPFSGAATPFVYFICLVAMLITASGVMAMAARLPSAGAFYTYVTRGLGPRSGFVTGGLMFVAYALLPPAEIGLIGSYLQQTLNDELGIHVPWWLVGLVPAVLMILLAYHGISSSIKVAMILFVAEVVVVMTISIIVVASGGADGLTLAPLTPAASPNGWSGITTGFVFAALSFVGFEGAATLSEEVRTPRRTVPRAVLLSVIIVGLIYVFCIWAEVNGLGITATNQLTGATTPWNDLAARYAPWLKLFIILASVSSMFAVMVNSNNGIIRIFFAMGRENMLPTWFSHINPKRRTPTNAVFTQGAFSVAAALLVGALAGGLDDPVGGSNVYGYLGFLLTLGILPVYVLTNLAAIRFLRKRPGFRPLPHLVLPALAIVLMTALLVGQILLNGTQPYESFLYAIIAWVVVVTAVAFWLGRRRPAVLAIAGSVLATGEAEADSTVGTGSTIGNGGT